MFPWKTHGQYWTIVSQNWTIESLHVFFIVFLHVLGFISPFCLVWTDSPSFGTMERAGPSSFLLFPGTLPGRTYDKGRVHVGDTFWNWLKRTTENYATNQILVLFVFSKPIFFWTKETHMVSNSADDTWPWCAKCGFTFLHGWYMFDCIYNYVTVNLYTLYIYTHDKVHLSYHWQVRVGSDDVTSRGIEEASIAAYPACSLLNHGIGSIW